MKSKADKVIVLILYISGIIIGIGMFLSPNTPFIPIKQYVGGTIAVISFITISQIDFKERAQRQRKQDGPAAGMRADSILFSRVFWFVFWVMQKMNGRITH